MYLLYKRLYFTYLSVSLDPVMKVAQVPLFRAISRRSRYNIQSWRHCIHFYQGSSFNFWRIPEGVIFWGWSQVVMIPGQQLSTEMVLFYQRECSPKQNLVFCKRLCRLIITLMRAVLTKVWWCPSSNCTRIASGEYRTSNGIGNARSGTNVESEKAVTLTFSL